MEAVAVSSLREGLQALARRHPLRPFAHDLAAMDWAIDRMGRLRKQPISLESLSLECAVIFDGMAIRPTISADAMALRLLQVRTFNKFEWAEYRRTAFAIVGCEQA